MLLLDLDIKNNVITYVNNVLYMMYIEKVFFHKIFQPFVYHRSREGQFVHLKLHLFHYPLI